MESTMIIISIPVTLKLLMNGSYTLTHEENIHIFFNVQRYILITERFV